MVRGATLYSPVLRELEQVEAALDSLTRADNPKLSEMMTHVLGGGGKRVRPAIALLAGKFGQYDGEGLVPLAVSIELLHTATLVHDDVIDRAATRRGRATANSIYDNGATVMLGDYMFAHAAEFVARTGNIEVVRLFAHTLMAMAGGELSQDMSAYDYGQTTMQYFQRIGGKTASLFAAAAEGGAIVSEAPHLFRLALRSYGENLGMAFQVMDDILDFTGDEAEMGKPVGSDLMQGTLTLPSLLLMERYPEDNPVRRLFRDRDRQRQRHLAAAIDMVLNSDILDECRRVAVDFRDRASLALADLPPSSAQDSLGEIADYVVERRS